jgi:hypothetical protein
MTSIAPTGRGAEPQVCTTVPKVARRPDSVHFNALRTTSRSTLSTGKPYSENESGKIA